jgi:limonene 1,2-monooxygenase
MIDQTTNCPRKRGSSKLQLLPLQEEMPMAVASMISPSRMTLAGKYGIGVLSVGSMVSAGLQALPTQWSFAEEAAQKSGETVHRKDWRIVMSWHIAETRKGARAQAEKGFLRWNNEYVAGTLMQPNSAPIESTEAAFDSMEGTASLVGTPDDLVEAVRHMVEVTGGFGTVIGFLHDWASPEDTRRSWDMVARYVIPEINGLLDSYRESRSYVADHRESFERAGEAILSKIMDNERAAEAMEESGGAPAPAFPGVAREPDENSS